MTLASLVGIGQTPTAHSIRRCLCCARLPPQYGSRHPRRGDDLGGAEPQDRHRALRAAPTKLISMEVLYGLHPVEEALKAGNRRFDHVLMARERRDARLEQPVAQCRQAGVRIREQPREQLTVAAKTPGSSGSRCARPSAGISRPRRSLRRPIPATRCLASAPRPRRR